MSLSNEFKQYADISAQSGQDAAKEYFADMDIEVQRAIAKEAETAEGKRYATSAVKKAAEAPPAPDLGLVDDEEDAPTAPDMGEVEDEEEAPAAPDMGEVEDEEEADDDEDTVVLACVHCGCKTPPTTQADGNEYCAGCKLVWTPVEKPAEPAETESPLIDTPFDEDLTGDQVPIQELYNYVEAVALHLASYYQLGLTTTEINQDIADCVNSAVSASWDLSPFGIAHFFAQRWDIDKQLKIDSPNQNGQRREADPQVEELKEAVGFRVARKPWGAALGLYKAGLSLDTVVEKLMAGAWGDPRGNGSNVEQAITAKGGEIISTEKARAEQANSDAKKRAAGQELPVGKK